MTCYQIWQKDYEGKRVLWAFSNTIEDMKDIAQIMCDSLREGWEDDFEIVFGTSKIEMSDFLEMYEIEKRTPAERWGL